MAGEPQEIAAPGPISVIGAGAMGAGIAQVAVRSGFEVLLVDPAAGAVDRALGAITKGLRRWSEKGEISREAAERACERVRGVSIDELGKAIAVIEAIVENVETKDRLFRDLDAVLPAGALLASNTSSISITRLGAATRRPGDVVGLHFFNPVPVMTLIEIVRGLKTSDATVRRAEALARALGKTPVVVQDAPGFVSNRILMPMINEAIFALEEGVATRDAIDQVMELGMRHPMGPLKLADLIGLDVCLFILEVLHRDLGDPKYRPCPLLRRKVAAGELGKKTGRGFYEY